MSPESSERYEKATQAVACTESQTRVALTRRFPKLLPLVLGTRRLLRNLETTIDIRYHTRKQSPIYTRTYLLCTHSSPLFRKYNKVELDVGKIENLKIATSLLDNIVIRPGQIFSFWHVVGAPRESRGFKPGLVLAGGQLETAIGGGLCQLSNLLAYLFAQTDCTFIERRHHSKDVFPDSGRVVPFASGATIFYNLIDLRVQNTTPNPITLHLRMSATQLRGSLSTPVQLPYIIKVVEKMHGFIQSKTTKKFYRYNQIWRVRRQKETGQIQHETLLFENCAAVMYSNDQVPEGAIIPTPLKPVFHCRQKSGML